MKIVIDIPEILYTKIQNGKADKRTLETVILHGKPLRCVLDEMKREIKEYTFKAHGTKFIYIDRLNHILNKAESEE